MAGSATNIDISIRMIPFFIIYNTIYCEAHAPHHLAV